VPSPEEKGIESIAVCFINSYMNPENELKMKKSGGELPGPTFASAQR